MALRAVLWDMDGLLVDSEPLWTEAEVELAARLGGTWDDGIKAAVAGTRLDVAVPAILRHFGVASTREVVRRTSEDLMARMVELYARSAPLMPGAAALLADLRTHGVPVALVSSSYRRLVDAVLAQGLGPFDLTVSGDEVTRGKPHPEPYLAAAAALGVPAADCVVLEDTRAGAAAGLAAGCVVVAVPSLPGMDFCPHPRLLVRASLELVSVRDLRAAVPDRAA